MMIYIDSEYRCHTSNPDGNFREVRTDAFKGKCSAFIEGYRYIPAGEKWMRSDGVVFHGEMMAPWKPYNELLAAQAQYEADAAMLTAAYQEGVNSV